MQPSMQLQCAALCAMNGNASALPRHASNGQLGDSTGQLVNRQRYANGNMRVRRSSQPSGYVGTVGTVIPWVIRQYAVRITGARGRGCFTCVQGGHCPRWATRGGRTAVFEAP